MVLSQQGSDSGLGVEFGGNVTFSVLILQMSFDPLRLLENRAELFGLLGLFEETHHCERIFWDAAEKNSAAHRPHHQRRNPPFEIIDHI